MNKIEKLIAKFCKKRDEFITELLDSAKTSSEKLFVLEQIKEHNLLPLADYICETPVLDKLFDDTDLGDYTSRNQAIYFCSYIEELKESLNKSEEEVIDYIYDIVKEDRIIGAYFDW